MLSGVISGCSGADSSSPSIPSSSSGLDPSGNWRMLIASDAFTCGIARTGAAYCWGVNERGELGNGDSAFAATRSPTPVAGGHRFVFIAAQNYTTCAISDAAEAYCWGAYNGFFSAPARVSSEIHFASIAVGHYEVCGVGTDAIPYCWTTISGYPRAPTPPDSALRMTGISGTQYQFCGATTSGAVACWTGDAYGNGKPFLVSTPAQTKSVATGGPFATIGPVDSHVCALETNGSVYCWGANRNGQLGDGSNTDRTQPVLAAGGLRMSAVGANYGRTCGIGVDSLAYCWGAIPAQTPLSTPTAVHPQLHFAQLSVGWGHTCGVTPSGAGYCWGANGVGQLGANRSETIIATPVRVIDPP